MSKDLLVMFAAVFTVLEPCNFRDIFSNDDDDNESGTNINALELIYHAILKNPKMLLIPQNFLANDSVSQTFASILLTFLLNPRRMQHLSGATSTSPSPSSPSPPSPSSSATGAALYEDFEMNVIVHQTVQAVQEGDDEGSRRLLGPSVTATCHFDALKRQHRSWCAAVEEEATPGERATVLLKLFKMTFGSVTLFEKNESVLLPHLCRIVTSCMKNALAAQEPDNYFYLMRALFRAIGGGKFDTLYKELLRVLPGLLKGLVIFQQGGLVWVVWVVRCTFERWTHLQL